MVQVNQHQLNEKQLETLWANEKRWNGITRPYTAKEVIRLRGSIHIEHSLARLGAERLWKLLHEEDYVAALGALTGNQAVQQVLAGLKAIYLSGWQVAGDANLAGQMYPDQSLYPCNSVPNVVKEINNAFLRSDQINHAEGKNGTYWFAPIVADAEAGFGGSLNAFELMKSMIEAGAAASTLRISWLQPRNADTWAARSWCRRMSLCRTGRGATGRRHSWRSHRVDCPHGREQRQAPDL